MRATVTQYDTEAWLRVVSAEVVDLPRTLASLSPVLRATLRGAPRYAPSVPTPAEQAEGYRYADWWAFGAGN